MVETAKLRLRISATFLLERLMWKALKDESGRFPRQTNGGVAQASAPAAVGHCPAPPRCAGRVRCVRQSGPSATEKSHSFLQGCEPASNLTIGHAVHSTLASR